MLDSRIRPIIDPPLNRLAASMTRQGISANQLTWIGFTLGIATLPLLAYELYLTALALILANRLFDGLDGALARQLGPTDFGAYLDIVLDFIFYSAVVFGFCLAQPENALYGAFLIFSFVGSGSAFLSFAILAEKRGLQTEAQGKKSIYYLSGLAEGFETIVALTLMCLLPEYFYFIALVFGLLCWLSTIGRVAQTGRMLR